MSPAPMNGLPEDDIERAHISELRQHRSEASERVIVLRKQVAPYYEAKRNISNAINHTHRAMRNDQADLVVIGLRLDPDSCRARADLFPQLDRLRAEYRPTLDELSYLQKHVKTLDKQIEHIEAWIEKQQKRKRKTDQLF